MAFGIDDILAKATDAALAAAAEGVAEGLLKAVLSFLMTKDDLERAVAEIEAYIGHEFEEFINDNVMVNTSSALAFLQNFANNPKEHQYLESALEPLHAAEGWLNAEIAQFGEDVLRKRYAEVVICTTTSVALWYNRALIDPNDKQNLADSITSLTDFRQ